MIEDLPILPDVDLSALGIDSIEMVELDPVALEAAASGTRTLDTLTEHLLALAADQQWTLDEATALVHLLEDPRLPAASREELVNALADQIHAGGYRESNDPRTLWAIGNALFDVHHTVLPEGVARVRLARALSGYSPDRRKPAIAN